MAKNCVPLLERTRTLWRPSTTIGSVPALWCNVRWQLQGLVADLVRYWVVRTLQLAMLLQEFLPKLIVCWLPCRTIFVATSNATNRVPLLEGAQDMLGTQATEHVFKLCHIQRRCIPCHN